jgi:hypothetical protein
MEINMKIKSLVIVAVLSTAVLCFGVAKAQTTDTATLIAQLQAQIASLMAQIQSLQTQQGSLTVATTTVPTLVSKTTGKSLVLILVDDSLVNQLSSGLATYQSDINKDLKLSSQIISISSTAKAEQVKSVIRGFYNKGNLGGVLLVGNIASPKTYFTDPPANPNDYSLTDAVYQDVYDNCGYSSSLDAYSYKNSFGCENQSIQPYWIGRLTPNSSKQTALSLLKNYFQRNHAYRTGLYVFQKNTLLYSPVIFSPWTSGTDADHQYTLNTVLNYYNTNVLNPYSQNQTKLIIPGYNEQRENGDGDYLKELQKQYFYETVLFNGHGSPTFHEVNTNPGDIKNANFFFADIRSCSVGKFTTQDNLTNDYLFNGNGFIVLANSVDVAASNLPSDGLYPLLSVGYPFYEALKVVGLGVPTNVLGDPTLRMRYNYTTPSNNSAGPIMNITYNNIVLTKQNPTAEIKIKNNGNSDLRFYITSNKYKNKFGTNLFDLNFSFPPIFTFSNGSQLLGSGKEGSITLTSSFKFDETNSGSYGGTIFIFSNDSALPVKEIPFNILSNSIQSSITVTSPNGGEIWKIGETHNITWQSSGLNTVSIYYFSQSDNTGRQYQIANSVSASTGLQSWTIPSSITPGLYKISIGNTTTVSDYSNNWFTIASASICTPNWQCTNWSACVNGKQTRTCTDLNNCGTTAYQPVTTQTCQTSVQPALNVRSAPASLKVGETGTWQIGINYPANTMDKLSFYAVWGDETTPLPVPVYVGPNNTSGADDAAKFYHSYSKAGAYNPIFTAVNPSNQSGFAAAPLNVTNCVPSIACTSWSDWSVCTNGYQTQTCLTQVDQNNCGPVSGQQAVSRPCTTSLNYSQNQLASIADAISKLIAQIKLMLQK